MDPITFITIIGGIIGIIAGSVQVLDYVEKRREKHSAIELLPDTKLTQKSSSISPHLGNPRDGMPTALPSREATSRQDWGEAVDVSVFYGRTEELAKLEQWVVQERCRLVVLLGMGGIGKTSVSIKLAQKIQNRFDYVIWRSLGNAPPVIDILADMIKFLSNQQETNLPEDVGARVSLLIDYLRKRRCLLILDNAESILRGGDHAGQYRDGYEDYGKLIKRISEASHQSCLILTSREKPGEVASSEGDILPVRSLQLPGLKAVEGEELFQTKGLSGSDDEQRKLIDFYKGNPLALRIISTTIKEVFDGNIAEFLAQGSVIFGRVRDLLDQQFNRLSDLEREVMYWLAINREPVSVAQLREDIVSLESQPKLIEVLQSLVRRSLIEKATPTSLEKSATFFTLQPVVMEYLTDCLIEQVCEEIQTGKIEVFNRYPLIKATEKDYVRETQLRLILKPVAERLLTTFGSNRSATVGAQGLAPLQQILLTLREQSPRKHGYAIGNILNLLRQLQTDLSGLDFSNLTVWQAYLQGTTLHHVNFTGSDLAKSVFTQAFDRILSVAFSPDGKLLATGDAVGEVCLWQVVDGQQLLAFKGHPSGVGSVAFSPDGQTLATSSGDQTVKLWSVSSGQCLKTLQGHTAWVRSVTFSPDGQMLASGSSDRTVKLWSVSLGQCLKTLQGHTDWVNLAVFSPDSQMLASGSDDQTVKLWSVSSGQCLKTLQRHTNSVQSVTFSPNGQMLASGSDDQTVKLWSVSTGQCLKTLQGHTNLIRSVAFSPDGQMLASGSDDQTVKLWSVSTGQCLKTLQGHTNALWSVAFSPDGQMLASGSDDQTVKLWSVSTGQCLKTLQEHSGLVRSVTFSPNGQILASSSEDRMIMLWNVSTGQCLKTLQSNGVSSVTFSPDGQILASDSDDRNMRLWNVSTGQCLKTLQGHSGLIRSVTFSPDGQILASGSGDQTVKIWSVSTGQCVQTWQGHTGSVRSVTFSPDGQILASSSDDRTIKLWSVSIGQCLKTLQGHTNSVRSVTFSPDGQILASGSGGQTILWNVSTGRCLRTLQSNGVYSVTFSPVRVSKAFSERVDQTLASGSDDGTIKLLRS